MNIPRMGRLVDVVKMADGSVKAKFIDNDTTLQPEDVEIKPMTQEEIKSFLEQMKETGKQ